MKAYTYNDRLVGVGNDQILGTDQGGGSTYTAGQYVSIDSNDVISVTGLAPVSAIPDVSDMATQTWVGEQGYLTEVPSNYATDTEVSQAIASSVTDFVTESQVTALIPDTEDVTFEEINLTNYALASAIPDVTSYATHTEVYNATVTAVNVATGLIPDVSDMATQTWVNEQGFLTAVPSNYATDIEVSQAIASSIVQSDWAVTAVDSPAYIDNKPETLEMEILPVYAGEGITIESSTSGIVISAQSGGTTYTAGQYISIDSNDVISVTGLQVAGSYATTSDISDMATQTWVGNQGYLSSVPEGYATDQELAEAVTAVTSIIPDTSDMATKTWVGNQGYLTSVPSNYATDTEVSEAIASSIPTFTEGNCIDITSNVISWETTAGITDIISVTALPANPVATVIYLIPET